MKANLKYSSLKPVNMINLSEAPKEELTDEQALSTI